MTLAEWQGCETSILTAAMLNHSAGTYAQTDRKWPQMAIESFALPLTEQKLGKKNQFEIQILANRPIRFIKGNAAREYQWIYGAGGRQRHRGVAGDSFECA
jgi:hypothetical protein